MIPGFILRHRGLIFVFWIMATAFLLTQVPDLQKKIDFGSRWENGPSREASDALAREFPSLGRRQAIVVIDGLDLSNIDRSRLELYELFDSFRDLPFVAGIDSPASLPDSSLLVSDQMAVGIISVQDDFPLEPAIESLREKANELLADYLPHRPTARIHITGAMAIDYDTIHLSNQHIRGSETLALPIILLLLFWVFGSVTACLLPIMLAVLAIGMTLGLLSLAAEIISISIMAKSMASLLGLALGTDYALLMVAGYRKALARGAGSLDAAVISLKTAGRTIMVSGVALVIGLSALIPVPAAELRSIAISGVLVTMISMALSLSLLPAVLCFLGSRVNALSIRRSLIGRDITSGWRKWSEGVARRPWLALMVSALILTILAYPAKDLTLSFPDEGWMSSKADSIQGIAALREANKSGLVYRLTVMYEHTAPDHALSKPGWQALKEFQALLKKDERVAQVISLVSLVPETARFGDLQFLLSDSLISRFRGVDQRFSRLEIIPRSDIGVTGLTEMVEAIRSLDTSNLTTPPAGIHVAGLPAATYDYLQLFNAWLPKVILLVVLGTLVALLISFRSVLIPLKAVVLNLLTVGATFGVFQLIFMEGYGSQLFGLEHALDGIFPAIPFLVFCTVFGISMDYEILLIRSVQQARRCNVSEKVAVIEGLASSSRIISSAAVIMIAVFGAFAFGNFLPVTMLGVTLAMALILDATLGRLVLSPALLLIAGRWNWWPGHTVPGRDSGVDD